MSLPPSDSIQANSQVHVFFCKVLSLRCPSMSLFVFPYSFFHPHINIELLLVVSCLPFSPHAQILLTSVSVCPNSLRMTKNKGSNFIIYFRKMRRIIIIIVIMLLLICILQLLFYFVLL